MYICKEPERATRMQAFKRAVAKSFENGFGVTGGCRSFLPPPGGRISVFLMALLSIGLPHRARAPLLYPRVHLSYPFILVYACKGENCSRAVFQDCSRAKFVLLCVLPEKTVFFADWIDYLMSPPRAPTSCGADRYFNHAASVYTARPCAPLPRLV